MLQTLLGGWQHPSAAGTTSNHNQAYTRVYSLKARPLTTITCAARVDYIEHL